MQGYRIHKDQNLLDLWIDAQSQESDHLDILFQHQRKTIHQKTVIKGIWMGTAVGEIPFDLTPPPGHSLFEIKQENPESKTLGERLKIRAEIKPVPSLVAVVGL